MAWSVVAPLSSRGDGTHNGETHPTAKLAHNIQEIEIIRYMNYKVLVQV